MKYFLLISNQTKLRVAKKPSIIVNIVRLASFQRIMATKPIWSFGYGSNMDVKSLEARKHVKVIEHTPAILKDFKMTFSLKALHHVEPYFSGLTACEGAEVHGVAFSMDAESAAQLDRMEGGGTSYDKTSVRMTSYDGRDLQGFIYMNKTPPKGDFEPSSRYLSILVKGAKDAGLDPDYIDKLSKRQVYQPDDITLQSRKKRPDPDSLPEITVADLAKHKGDHPEPWLACLGYVIATKVLFVQEAAHQGRDITTRELMRHHGIPLDDNDDAGQPPYPILKDLSKEELEYVTRWLDHYELNPDGTSKEAIVGYLKEFKDQQKSGITNFKLPQ